MFTSPFLHETGIHLIQPLPVLSLITWSVRKAKFTLEETVLTLCEGFCWLFIL
uniref:Uncharacterized protein n=1 Tax=Anguilla anguilla TaxID=7936 RepID=A0A0E9SWQ3_ANGAN